MVRKIDATMEGVFERLPAGSISRAIGNTFYSINHRGTQAAIQQNRDFYGLTLFTRPQLNMSLENLRSSRAFIPLLTQDTMSIGRAVRSYLDPRLYLEGIDCPVVDPENVFLPLLGNHCLSVSGWPDIELQSYQSEPGVYKEVFGFVDSTDDLRGAYTVTASFRNMPGSPILVLIRTWMDYMQKVFRGDLVPYPDYIMHNKIDYNTRIWRLILDPTKTYVVQLGCCGAAYPVSWPGGKTFDYRIDQPLNTDTHELSIQFQCYGAMYNDPVLVRQFNQAVSIFCPSMRDKVRSAVMQKVPPEAMGLLNNTGNSGFARINPDTYELEWYVRKDDYKEAVDNYNAVTRSFAR